LLNQRCLSNAPSARHTREEKSTSAEHAIELSEFACSTIEAPVIRHAV